MDSIYVKFTFKKKKKLIYIVSKLLHIRKRNDKKVKRRCSQHRNHKELHVLGDHSKLSENIFFK